MQRRIIVLTVIAAAAIVTVAGCTSSKNTSGSTPTTTAAAGAGSPTSAAAVSGTVTVLAAASLKEAFTTLGTQFESAHPGTHVKLSFGASSDLAEQINQGAPADVFASASPKNMQQVVGAGGASKSTNFAKNVMEVAVPPGNPAQVTGVSDLANRSVKVALCEPQVPCGAVGACPDSRGTWVTIHGELYAAAPAVSAWLTASGWACW
jgi:molybdate transport system substrate-binding protein